MNGKVEKLWTVRFRVIASYDMTTPYMYLPIQQTGIRAKTPDEAWEKLLLQVGDSRDDYNRIEIFEA